MVEAPRGANVPPAPRGRARDAGGAVSARGPTVVRIPVPLTGVLYSTPMRSRWWDPFGGDGCMHPPELKEDMVTDLPENYPGVFGTKQPKDMNIKKTRI